MIIIMMIKTIMIQNVNILILVTMIIIKILLNEKSKKSYESL